MQDPDSFIVSSDAYAFADASLLPARGVSPAFTVLWSLPDPLELITAVGPTAVPALLAPTKEQAKSKEEGPHKRQISEAVPRAEREVTRVPQEVAKAVHDDLRKSARQRQRRPKLR